MGCRNLNIDNSCYDFPDNSEDYYCSEEGICLCKGYNDNSQEVLCIGFKADGYEEMLLKP